MVHSYWEHRNRGWRMLKRAKRSWMHPKAKVVSVYRKMVFTGNTAIILNIRHEFKLALPYAQLSWKLSDADTQLHLRPFCSDHLLETVGSGRTQEAEALWIHFDCATVDDLDGHGQIRLLLQRRWLPVCLVRSLKEIEWHVRCMTSLCKKTSRISRFTMSTTN